MLVKKMFIIYSKASISELSMTPPMENPHFKLNSSKGETFQKVKLLKRKDIIHQGIASQLVCTLLISIFIFSDKILIWMKIKDEF